MRVYRLGQILLFNGQFVQLAMGWAGPVLLPLYVLWERKENNEC